MKRYLPLLGIFLLFFLVVSGFAHGQALQPVLKVEKQLEVSVSPHELQYDAVP